MIKIRSELDEILEIDKIYLSDTDSNKYIDSNNFYIKQIPHRIFNHIKEFYSFNSSNNESLKYILLLKPLRHNEFIKNFKNLCYYEFINKLSITEINYIFDIAEILRYSNLEDLCAAKLADYFKKITPREMKEKFLLFKTHLSDEDIRYINEIDPDLKELNKRINDEKELIELNNKNINIINNTNINNTITNSNINNNNNHIIVEDNANDNKTIN